MNVICGFISSETLSKRRKEQFTLPAMSFAEQLLSIGQPASKSSLHTCLISNKQKESFHFKKLTNHLSMAALASTDVLIYVDLISHKQSLFSSQIHTPSFPINWPSLVSTAWSPIILWRVSDLIMINLRRHDSNKYHTKAFVICDLKSGLTRSVTHINKTYLLWLIYWLLFNQHYQHCTNQ